MHSVKKKVLAICYNYKVTRFCHNVLDLIMNLSSDIISLIQRELPGISFISRFYAPKFDGDATFQLILKENEARIE